MERIKVTSLALPLPITKSAPPTSVCPFHAAFMVAYTIEPEPLKQMVARCFRCPNLDCPLIDGYGRSDGHFKIEAGELKRLFPA
jgi:hypothetical protein